LSFANNYLKILHTTLIAVLIFFFVQLKTALAQHDTLKIKSDWNAGTLALKDQTIMEGYIQHDEKLRSIKFKSKLTDRDELSFAELAILSMKYYDNNISKTREFYTWSVIDEGSTIQGPALYEIIMVMKNFVVLTRKFGVLPTQGRRVRQGDVNNAKIEYDKVEKIFLAKEGASAELLSLAPLENEKPKSPPLIQPFFSGDVMKNYMGSYWRQVKSFVKKNQLNLKLKADLMEALTYYQQIENID
jgi:hypothetical protein